MNPKEKHEICFKCEHYKHPKCGLVKCMSCYKEILFSKLGECPEGKWKRIKLENI